VAVVKELWLLHGVNLDMLGARPPEHYGTLTLAQLEARVVAHGEARGFAVRCFHTTHAGSLVETHPERALAPPAAIVINPGAWTHYSYALRDALELVAAPVAEVHLSAVERREEWRRTSVIAELAAVRISGRGVDGYLEAIDALAQGFCGPDAGKTGAEGHQTGSEAT
jgi:3-dehydroquinate dehydratase-2